MCNGNKLSRGSCDEINVNERARVCLSPFPETCNLRVKTLYAKDKELFKMKMKQFSTSQGNHAKQQQ